MTLLDRVAVLLTADEIPFALIGAAALAARGIARSTFDIDLPIDPRVLDGAFWEPLSRVDVNVDVRRGDADDPLAGVVRLESPGQRPVDVVVGRYAWQARAVAAAERLRGEPPVVTAHDLILLKLYAGGSQDLWDIRELLALPGAENLVAAVTAGLDECPPAMRETWDELRRE
jgi:hypothetical protein